MDAQRFDALTRRLSRPRTRRWFVKSAVGGAAATLAAAATVSDSLGYCSRIFSDELPCSVDAQCLGSEYCTPDGFCCADGSRYCQNLCSCVAANQPCGTSCSPGLTRCATGCTPTSRDTQNCGACGHRCAPGQSCSNGTCCRKGTISCNGVCKPASQCLPEV